MIIQKPQKHNAERCTFKLVSVKINVDINICLL